MPDPILVFRLLERLRHGPFKIQGSKTSQTHAIANFEEKYGGHVFRLPLSRQKEIGTILAAAANRPLCAFALCDVEIPELTAALEEIERLKGLNPPEPPEEESVPLEEMSFRRLYAYAREIGLPRYSVIGKSGQVAPLLEAIQNYEKAASTPDGSSHPAPSETLQTSAA